jgi:hypothetical protein
MVGSGEQRKEASMTTTGTVRTSLKPIVKAQKSLTPTVNKLSKYTNYNPFLSPDQQSKSSGVRRVNTNKVNTFLQRMDMFGTLDRRHSPLRKNKAGRTDSSYRKRDNKRSLNKSKLLSKVKGGKNSMTPGSLKRMRKFQNENYIGNKKRYCKKQSKKSLTKGKNESSLMFSKFLRSMEMGESPGLKYDSSSSRDKSRGRLRWLVQPQLLEMVINAGALMFQVWDCLQGQKDIYDLVKDYVEISQNPSYNKLEDLMRVGDSDNFGKQMAFSLKIERWVIMYFFYFSFKKEKQERVLQVLLLLAKKMCENCYCCMMSLRATGAQAFELEKVKREVEALMESGGVSTRKVVAKKLETVELNNDEMVNLLKIW